MSPDVDHPTPFWRLDTFSDSIFAVAMTLLVFTFPITTLPTKMGPAAVQTLLQGLSSQYEAFVISFLVVAAFWASHHRVFDTIQRYDQVLVWLNFGFLLLIVFVPFPTAVLINSQDSWLPVAFYASSIACAGLFLTLVWVYAAHNFRLIDPSTPIREVRFSTLQALVVPMVFLLSIVVAFGSAQLAEYFWIFSFVAQWAVSRERRKGTAS